MVVPYILTNQHGDDNTLYGQNNLRATIICREKMPWRDVKLYRTPFHRSASLMFCMVKISNGHKLEMLANLVVSVLLFVYGCLL